MMKYQFAMAILFGAICFVGVVPPVGPKCSISIEATANEAKSGSAVYVKIHLLNTGDNEITSRGPHSNGVDSLYQYDCRDEAGNSAKRETTGLFGPGGDHPIQSIKPGDSYDQLVSIDKVCDLSRPGKYTVQISRVFPSEASLKTVDKDARGEVVKSNTITITVVGPKPEDAEPR
jgi:hypothetical protein